jgi:Cu(I)/Ag(I) efflux system membrane fusion protein
MGGRQIEALEARGRPIQVFGVASPRKGVVLRRGVTVGAAVDPSTELFTIADLSKVWVLAEIPEADIPLVAVGTEATLDMPHSGREPFRAPIAFLYPMLSERTRTLRARFEIENEDGRLRPGLYGTADLAVKRAKVLTVARDAVVDTGRSQHVFVVEGTTFSPRLVTPGVRMDERIEITSGLEAGERVVASGVFLLDSESRLRASGSTGHQGHGSHGDSPDRPPQRAPQRQSAPQRQPRDHEGHRGHEGHQGH